LRDRLGLGGNRQGGKTKGELEDFVHGANKHQNLVFSSRGCYSFVTFNPPAPWG
jgi:hypothetical protein